MALRRAPGARLGASSRKYALLPYRASHASLAARPPSGPPAATLASGRPMSAALLSGHRGGRRQAFGAHRSNIKSQICYNKFISVAEKGL